MPINIKTSPVLCAACGAALSYYCLFPLYRSDIISIDALLALMFIPVFFLSLCKALVSYHLTDASPQTLQQLRLMPLRLTAFAVGLALGVGAGTMAIQSVSFGIPEDSVQGITGTVLDDPRLVSGGRAMTRVSMKMVSGRANVRVGTRGAITVFFPEESAERLKEFGRGAEIYAEGSLRESSPRGGMGNFNSGEYIFIANSLHVTQVAPPMERFRTNVRMGAAYRFTQSQFGDPKWGGLALAMLVGIRDNLDVNFTALYRDAGCAYILAFSGMQLAVLVGILSFLFRRLLGLRVAAISGAVFILVYCFLVGPTPSLTRAALMYFLGVAAILGMLKKDALLLLCMAFLLQLAFTPQTGFSLSFIYSYIALAGIIILGGALNAIFKGKIPTVLLLSLAASLGAFIVSAPVTMWAFDVLRPVGIITSLAAAPLTTLFMILAVVWLGLNLIAPALSPLLGYPLSWLYWLMEKIAVVSAKLPGLVMPLPLTLVLSAACAAAILWFGYRRNTAVHRMEPFT